MTRLHHLTHLPDDDMMVCEAEVVGLIRVLQERGDPVDHRLIAQATSVSEARVRQIEARLPAGGMLRLRRCPDCGRGYLKDVALAAHRVWHRRREAS